MRRPLIISLVAAVFAALLAGGVAVAGPNVTVPTKTVTITPAACPAAVEFCFKPGPLTVKPGTKVVWNNTSDTAHTVTRCTVALCGVSGGTGKDPNFHSPTIPPGKTFSFTFHKPGTYKYFCKVHGYSVMHGTITVH